MIIIILLVYRNINTAIKPINSYRTMIAGIIRFQQTDFERNNDFLHREFTRTYTGAAQPRFSTRQRTAP